MFHSGAVGVLLAGRSGSIGLMGEASGEEAEELLQLIAGMQKRKFWLRLTYWLIP